MSQVSKFIVPFCAVVIAVASVASALGGIAALTTRPGAISASIWSPTRSKIIEELVRTDVELTRGLNQGEFHKRLIDTEVDVQVSKLSHSLNDKDIGALDELISKLSNADQLWKLSNDPHGSCASDSSSFIRYKDPCLTEANMLIKKLDRDLIYANSPLDADTIRQPALDGAGIAVSLALRRLTAN
jgi:hypothetical protein